MPYLKIQTNTFTGDENGFLRRASFRAAAILEKPEEAMCVALEPSVPMLLGGTDAPAVFAKLKGLNFPEERTAEIASQLSAFIAEELEVPTERIYCIFENVSRHMWAWKGTTFDAMGK
ncbi:phenylpyruvate tautomerase MIF-related protein [Desulfohalobium retbaense]|uniref:L-dopachrome isomerase n=1 Tax=Desulfohalobium retbaense (strain ATCC 49708 / DSM 5692 / JCM 16813 / HR100) TaxID=485915 RepID=C8X003_DESRD|nr:phenylpyruvate tautomerase MIF-related protein [Desulfohalobium retbaense]ACV67628.1 macrophage migration inhibitory factor family protein [Desulfohalobium retbaense DSM 5692]